MNIISFTAITISSLFLYPKLTRFLSCQICSQNELSPINDKTLVEKFKRMSESCQDELVNKYTNWITLFRCGYYLDQLLSDNKRLKTEINTVREENERILRENKRMDSELKEMRQ